MARSIPNNQEAEQALLSTMFLSKYALDKAVDTLQEDDFYYNNNRIIFNTLVDLSRKNIPIDMTSVVTEIKNNDKLNEVGGISYLTEVLNSEAVASNAEYYIKNIHDAALLRNLIKASEEIQNLGYETNNDVNEVLDEAEKKILNIVKNKQTSEFRNFNDVLIEAQRNLEELAESKGDITGIASGFTDLDRITAGFHENQLIIVAARPAMGKTVFALNLAVNAALAGKSVAVFNLEMDATQLANRMLSNVGQIEGRKFLSGNFNNDDWTRLHEAISQLEGAKIFINDTPSATIGEIRSKCRRLASSAAGLDMVIIDYLQLISSGSHNFGANRQQEVSEISRALKLMALELHVPVIALSQLSRSVEQREDKRPLMSDLRESGSIEQDADIVTFLYRDSYYKKEARNESGASVSELIIGKHRNGRIDTVKLIFKSDTCSFLNYQKEESGD